MFRHIVDACVELCFLKKEFLGLTINMQLLYFITTVTSQVHSARYQQRAGTVLYRASSSKCRHVYYLDDTIALYKKYFSSVAALTTRIR